MKCRHCGNELPPQAEYCDNCGREVKKVAPLGIRLLIAFIFLAVMTAIVSTDACQQTLKGIFGL